MEQGGALAWVPGHGQAVVVAAAARELPARMVELVRSLGASHGDAVVVCARRPYTTVAQVLANAGVTSPVTYVDCSGAWTPNVPPSRPGLHFIESPTQLETALLRTELLVQRLAPGRRYVIVDSISRLADANGADAVAEAMHRLVTAMRVRGAPLILLHAAGTGAGDEVLELVRPFCDQVLEGDVWPTAAGAPAPPAPAQSPAVVAGADEVQPAGDRPLAVTNP